MKTIVIIPAFNEAPSIGLVVRDIPADRVDEVVVVDNGSADDTSALARAAGATVLREERRGYGWACLKGIEYAASRGAEVCVFLDGDYSDFPEELVGVVDPIERGEADLVIGSRTRGRRERGALLPQARLGNRVACVLMRLLWGARCTDLGPFRAIRLDALRALDMRDKTYGWTVEMQIKAARIGLRTLEVPVSYRKRIGVSKVTGTLSGTVKASVKILWTIGRHAIQSLVNGRSLRGFGP